jgi:hypothetical protein
MSGSAKAGTTPERHTCELRVLTRSQLRAPPQRARGGLFFSLEIRLGRKSHPGSKITSSCRGSNRFDSVTKDSAFPDHACRAALFGPFGYCRTAFLIPIAPMQNNPDQITGLTAYLAREKLLLAIYLSSCSSPCAPVQQVALPPDCRTRY